MHCRPSLQQVRSFSRHNSSAGQMLFSSFTKETSEAQEGTYLGHMANPQHRYQSPKAVCKEQVQPRPHIHTHTHTHTHTHAHTVKHTHTHTQASGGRGQPQSLELAGDPGSCSFQSGTVSPILVPKSLSLVLTLGKYTPPGSPLPSLLGLGTVPDCGKLLRAQGVPFEGEAPRSWRGEQLLTYYPDTLNPWPHPLQRKQLNQVAPGIVGTGRALQACWRRRCGEDSGYEREAEVLFEVLFRVLWPRGCRQALRDAMGTRTQFNSRKDILLSELPRDEQAAWEGRGRRGGDRRCQEFSKPGHQTAW